METSLVNQVIHESSLLILKAQQELEDARAELCLALGYGELKQFVLGEKIIIKLYASSLEPLLDLAKKSNPNLVALRAELSEKKFQYESAQSEHYPTVSATGYAGVNPWKEKLLDSNYAAAGVNLNIPLFVGGRVSAETRKKLYEIKALEKELIAKEHHLIKDIRLAWNNMHTSYQNISLLKDLFSHTSKAIDLAHKAYAQGKILPLQLVEHHLDKTQAEISFISAKYAYLMSCALLDLLLGSKERTAPQPPQVN